MPDKSWHGQGYPPTLRLCYKLADRRLSAWIESTGEDFVECYICGSRWGLVMLCCLQCWEPLTFRAFHNTISLLGSYRERRSEVWNYYVGQVDADLISIASYLPRTTRTERARDAHVHAQGAIAGAMRHRPPAGAGAMRSLSTEDSTRADRCCLQRTLRPSAARLAHHAFACAFESAPWCARKSAPERTQRDDKEVVGLGRHRPRSHRCAAEQCCARHGQGFTTQ